MKINFFSNASKITSVIFGMLLFLSLGIQAQPQSGTCYFVGETVVNGVNTNDTLPPIFANLAPGTCKAGLVNVPCPVLNVPGCASIQSASFGPVTPRNETGCTFAESCTSSFGCNIITTTTVPGPALSVPGPPAVPPSPLCNPPFIPAAQLVIAKSGTSSFGHTYTMQIAPAVGGPFVTFGTYTSGNGVTEFYNLAPGVTYFPNANNFIRPTEGWGVATTFGECLPTFQFRTGGAYTSCFDSLAANPSLDTFTPFGAGKFYRVFRAFATSNCQLVRAVQPIIVQDLEPPVIVGCPKAVILNLGPGECTKSWDAPPLMAMDNCAGSSFFGAERVSPGCQTAYSIVWNPGFFGGNMFDVTNVSTSALAINGIDVAWRNADSIRLYYTTQPGSHLPVRFNPAAWTLCPTKPFCNGNGGAFPAPPATTIDFRTQKITVSTNCSGTITRDTVRVGCPLIQPGETRGLYFAGQTGVGGMYWSNGGCASGAPFGDANLKIASVPEMSCVFGTGFFGVGGGIAISGNQQFVGNVRYSLTSNLIAVVQTCGQPYGPGCYFPVGCQTLCYMATDAAGNVTTCQFQVCVNPYPNPVTFLACQDDIQISLDQNCSATITSDEVLAGGPYRCFNDYIVTIQDWITNAVIDRNPNLPGSQVGVQDIGRALKITVRDPLNGNSCWSHATVEDKIPPRITCPRDTCVACYSDVTPTQTGFPVIVENCGSYSSSFKDNVSWLGCVYGYDRIITRTWTAIDAYNNKSSCIQNISVGLGKLGDISVPLNYDNIDRPMLKCNEKCDSTFDYTKHYLNFPYCVDGWLLDSTIWKATGGFYPSPAGDLAGVRLPRILGWNCIDTGLYQGHPSPFGQFYPAHPNWRINNPVCWGPDEQVLWAGTGYPGGANCRNLGVTFQDIVIDLAKPNCNAGPVGCYKVLRQWTIIDWCTSLIGGTNQIIKVADAFGPTILYPDTLVVNMESQACLGRWEVSPAWLVDNCSVEIHYTVQVQDGVVLGNETSGYVVVNMPPGIQNGYIVAEDCCGNITQRRIALNVVDNVPPNADCEQHTVVSITGNQTPGNNFAKVFASSFDQGSFDNCSPHVFFKVIRMDQLRGTNNGSNTPQPDNGTNCAGVNGDDNAILDGNQIYFDDYVNFCCSDVNKTLTVVFRVFDRDPGTGPVSPSRMNPGGALFNRFSDCMVLVDVQDKTVPTVVAPPNIVVSCSFWFDVTHLTDPNDVTFGKVVTDLGLRAKVHTWDIVCYKYCLRNDITGYPGFVPGAPPSNPPAWNRACGYYQSFFDTAHFDRIYDLTWGFDGYVLSGCGNTPTISVNDNRECGQGQLTRTVVARGPNGISVTATQTIWVVDCSPFYINRADNCDPLDDITWPGNCTGQATTIAGCGADISPDNPVLGRPTIQNHADDLCALISIDYVDEIFTIEPDACFKILRHWTVIDWCQYDPSIDPVKGRWSYLQIIKVHDTDKPVITISVGPCEPAVKNAVDHICYGHLSIKADATDNCSPADWLFYDYKIDLFNDGKGKYSGFDVKSGPLTRKDFANGGSPLYHDNPYADDPNNPFDASGTYPLGIHKICWYVEDGCGNIAALCQLFEIKDCKAPTPYCLTGVITVPMPVTKCITIWAKDLDRGSFDNCTDQANLKFYFNGDTSRRSITICCDDFVAAGANDELIVDVQMWVEDEQGNTDYCKTVIIVQDNQDVCPNTGSFGNVIGELRTENGDLTELTNMQLLVSAKMMKDVVTPATGNYFFGELPINNYNVKLSRIDNPTNGVTTADIVKIQRHILGIEKLNSPYKLIAADVNNSSSITAADVSEIRKLILGVISNFKQVESWTFVPKDYVFQDPTKPWSAPRDVNFTITNKYEHYIDNFVSIKMGDVTLDAKANSNVNGSSSRSNGKLHLEIDNNATVAGELYKVAFKSSDYTNIAGYQFTLKFDRQLLAFDGIEAGALNVDESNFGTNRINEGVLTTSFNSKVAQSVDANTTLFTVVFRANGKSNIGSMIALNGDVTAAEAYDAGLNIKDVSLGVRTNKGVVESGIFELYQNQPNPFEKETAIKFSLPEAGAVKLSIYDVTGKVLRVFEITGTKGMNTQRVKKSDLNATGVLYYQLDAVDHTATKRMVVIE